MRLCSKVWGTQEQIVYKPVTKQYHLVPVSDSDVLHRSHIGLHQVIYPPTGSSRQTHQLHCLHDDALCKAIIKGFAMICRPIMCCAFLYTVDAFTLIERRDYGCSWQALKSLSVPRCYASLVNIHSRLYLVGGRSLDSGNILSVDSIERYDEYMDEWQMFARLRTARHDAACTAVGQYSVCLHHTRRSGLSTAN